MQRLYNGAERPNRCVYCYGLGRSNTISLCRTARNPNWQGLWLKLARMTDVRSLPTCIFINLNSKKRYLDLTPP
ncbi:MAG: hypothetical protein RIB93_28510 [Coleofasciculus sp. D1-CHI-01]|uniref:hypothetical protein n=1 Tax=Coleofasciculus sp. D1-CHI-01 TaxID=3068482 RepID=UPI003304B43E